jgi:hypothetical protein
MKFNYPLTQILNDDFFKKKSITKKDKKLE